MARKTPSRLELRKQQEAVEAQGGEPARKKAAAKKTTTARGGKRTKEKAIARKKLVWVVFNGSMKEEGRFPYDQRAAAEEKIEQLKLKSAKKLYFIQPVKETLGDGKAVPALAAAARDEETKASRKAKAAVEEEEEEFAEDEEDEDEEDEDEE